ncbi:MAG TPA: rod shape-determining protein MreC [Thermoanaerobaculaceae bacterium]|nr:rod shape-determining protein MreC [Thermoanaerobaculaceae bacterium]
MVQLRLRPDLAIVVVCIGLYIGSAAQARSPLGGTALSVAVATIAAPAVAVGNAVGAAWQLFWTGQRDLRSTLAELRKLRLESAELRRNNQLLSAEVTALRQGSRLLAAYPSLAERSVLARVIARDLPRTHTLRLDRGSRDGIHVDGPVLGEGGLVGRVDQVLEHSCRVQLLSHPAAAAAAAVAGVQQEALLVGGDQPRLTGLSPYTQVPLDSPILSTGSEGIYPPGLVFGTTLEARNDGLFTVVPVRLAANAAEVTVVLVLAPTVRGAP